MLLALLLIKGL